MNHFNGNISRESNRYEWADQNGNRWTHTWCFQRTYSESLNRLQSPHFLSYSITHSFGFFKTVSRSMHTDTNACIKRKPSRMLNNSARFTNFPLVLLSGEEKSGRRTRSRCSIVMCILLYSFCAECESKFYASLAIRLRRQFALFNETESVCLAPVQRKTLCVAWGFSRRKRFVLKLIVNFRLS